MVLLDGFVLVDNGRRLCLPLGVCGCGVWVAAAQWREEYHRGVGAAIGGNLREV